METIKHFFSFVTSECEPINQHQLVLDNYTTNTEKEIIPKSSKSMQFTNQLLTEFFFRKLNKTDGHGVNKYLDFHYQHYTGNKNDFLENLKYIIAKKNAEINNRIKSYAGTPASTFMLGGHDETFIKNRMAIEWINKQNTTPETGQVQSQETINKYPQIFSDTAAFKLFEALQEQLDTQKFPYAKYGFIYNQMKKDNYLVHPTEPKFMKFLLNNYQIEFKKESFGPSGSRADKITYTAAINRIKHNTDSKIKNPQ